MPNGPVLTAHDNDMSCVDMRHVRQNTQAINTFGVNYIDTFLF